MFLKLEYVFKDILLKQIVKDITNLQPIKQILMFYHRNREHKMNYKKLLINQYFQDVKYQL